MYGLVYLKNADRINRFTDTHPPNPPLPPIHLRLISPPARDGFERSSSCSIGEQIGSSGNRFLFVLWLSGFDNSTELDNSSHSIFWLRLMSDWALMSANRFNLLHRLQFRSTKCGSSSYRGIYFNGSDPVSQVWRRHKILIICIYSMADTNKSQRLSGFSFTSLKIYSHGTEFSKFFETN